MKVIIIIDNLDLTKAGGVGSFLYDLCCELNEKNIDLSIVSIVKNDNENDYMKTELENRGIKTYCAGANTRYDALIHFGRYLMKVRKTIKQVAKDDEVICHLHLKLAVLYGAIATYGMKNVKCVETYHSQYSNYWIQNKVLSKRIALYISCSDSAREEMVERFAPKPERLISIPNGVRCSSLRDDAAEGSCGEKHDFQIVSVGRFTKQKNFQITAKAFSSLSGDACYKIIGQGENEEEIKAACIGSHSVEIIGEMPRNNILAEVGQADIVVMPSLWEGLSIFMLETIALGIPLMLSDIASFRTFFGEKRLGPNELWRCCEWGFLVQTTNPDAYREAMEYYRKNPKLKEKMRTTVLEIAKKTDMSICAGEYLNAFERLFSDKSISKGLWCLNEKD